MPRDGVQGWSRAKETAWLRVFEKRIDLDAYLDEFRCDPPCESCKCPQPASNKPV